MKTRLLTSSDIATLVSRHGLDSLMDDLIRRLEENLRRFDEAIVSTPVRSGFHYGAGLLEWMPCRIEGKGSLMKMVGYHPSNPARERLPTILSSALWFDASTGHLLAMADATFLTALRTGAASAAASRVLAKPSSSTVGVIGCGAQSVAQLHALARVFPLERAVAFDTDPAASRSLASRCAFLDLRFETVASTRLADLVAASDILCTCTSTKPASGPVFTDDPGIQAHLHINAVGSDFPGKIEVPVSILRRAAVVPDFPPQAVVEGECQQLKPSEIGPSMATIIRNPEAWAHLRNQLTVFDSTGWAFEDAVAFELLLELSEEYGVGSETALTCLGVDPRDPYGFLDASARRNTCGSTHLIPAPA